MKHMISVCFVFAVSCISAAPLDELMPQPRSAIAVGGSVSGDVCSRVKIVKAAVPGAPASVADEAYVLEIGRDGVTVTAAAREGELHARTTLAQLTKLSGKKIPCCRIVDWPSLRWRGFMIDTARNFQETSTLKDVIDMMAAYKLNLFHWHLTEYYAWRLQSRRFPHMEKKAFYDPSGNRQAGRFYTQEEFRELVDYAWKRGVTVMPEFDMPGHSVAFRRAFGFKTMRDPGVRETMKALIEELCSLTSPEKTPFIHLGGDEVWEEEEKIEEETMTVWAKAVTDSGRTVVGWMPGQKFKTAGRRVAMLWGKDSMPGVRCFDARGWYIEGYDPFELLSAAAYSPPFKDAPPAADRFGAIFCAWHDNAIGDRVTDAFRNQAVFPSCVLLGDLFWHGREHVREFTRRRLPLATDPRLAVARDIERRTIAQRDKVLTDLKYPFHFIRQTQMRWRLTDADGKLIARDIAQASVYPYHAPGMPQNFYHSPTGTVYAETWIKSPDDRTVGAWIGFTSYDRDFGRTFAGGTPGLGEWNRFGASIEINGERIAPPEWEQPGLDGENNKMIKYVKWAYEMDEIPYTNDEWYMREPSRVKLKKGWNHVKLTLPMSRPVNGWLTHRWVGTFIPVQGTTDHPREVTDLVYSSDPRPVDYAVHVPISNANIANCGGSDRVEAEVRRFDAKRVFLAIGKYAYDAASRADIMGKLKKNVRDFKARGFEVGAWNWTFWCSNTNGFTTMTGSDGWKSPGIVCPLDPAFRRMAGDYIRDFAKCGPDLIMFDDDYRYGNLHGSTLVCTCDRHMAKIREQLGENISPADLKKRVMTGGRNRYRDAWMDVNGQVLKDFAAEMRRRVDEVDPDIRLGLCAVMSLWDNDGVDAATISRILAGKTRPFIRLIGAPYWAVERMYYDGRLANIFEFLRMQRSWCSGNDIELFAEGDTYPRPRWRCPASHLELYDMAIRADGRFNGILKYGVDFESEADERGYALHHERNRWIYACIDRAFSHKDAVGVRVYEEMNRLRDLEIEDEQAGTTSAFRLFGSPAAKMMSTCGIPTTYEGEGLVGVAFGPNIKYVPQSAFGRGLVIDAWAARILMKRGVDVGIRKWVAKKKVGRELVTDAASSYGAAAFDAWQTETDPKVRPLGFFTHKGVRFPSAYVYENAAGAKFMVFTFDANFNGGGMIRSNIRPRQIANGVRMLSGKHLPAFTNGGLDVYLMAKDSDNERAVGIWNTSCDALVSPEIEIEGVYSSVEFINCTGRLEGERVTLSDVPAWSFAGFLLKK